MQKRINRLCDKIPDNWALCEFLDNFEAEMLVAQTLHACQINLEKRGEAFSFRGDGVFSVSGGGLVDNGKAYCRLLDGGYFEESHRQATDVNPPDDIRVSANGQVVVIVMTEKLLKKLEWFVGLSKESVA